MGSSPGFASTTRDSCRRLKDSLSLRLASKLNLAAHRDSLAHSTKGTPSHRMGAPTARGRAVSGAVSLPSRGAFHLSLTVLVRYRSWESAQPWRVVPPASDRVSRARPYSGSQTAVLVLRVRGSHPLRPAFPCRSARTWFCNCGRGLGAPGSASRNTCEATAPALAPSQVWARALSLAATRAISVDFSSSGYLDVSVPPVVPAWDGLPRGSRP